MIIINDDLIIEIFFKDNKYLHSRTRQSWLNKNIDIYNLSISNVKNDPKFFEMMLTDGKKKLYLRSVFAAQYSEKMIPHFRFIITERK